MITIKRVNIDILVLLLLPLCATSQSKDQSISELTADFTDRIYGVDQRIASGPFYNDARSKSIDGHPFYLDDEWKTGTVEFNDIVFENLFLKYDINLNEIVLKFTNQNNSTIKIAIRKSLVNRFTLDGRVFVPYPGTIVYDTAKFCEVLVSGPINYLILRTKEKAVSARAISNDYYYKELAKQYLQIDDKLEPFRTRRKLYKLFPQHKNEIKRFIRRERLQPYKNKIEDRATLIMYCNRLIEEHN